MEEPVGAAMYLGDERRRRWPGECPGVERRRALEHFETDQEPDQSPLANVVASISESLAARR